MAVVTGKDEQLLIGGQWVEAAAAERFDVTDPATGEIVGSVPDGAQEDVQRGDRRRRRCARRLEVAGRRSSARASSAAPPTSSASARTRSPQS